MFKFLFPKSRKTNEPFFKFQDSLISAPELWSSEIEDIVAELSDEDKSVVNLVLEGFQKNIELHFEYILNSKPCINFYRADVKYLFKSYFELTMVAWYLTTNYFIQHKIKYEIGDLIWWTIKYSFNGYISEFEIKSFKIFDKAVKDRVTIYPKLLSSYFKSQQKDPKVYQALFELICEKPLCGEYTEVDLTTSFLRNFENQKKMTQTLQFANHFDKVINSYSTTLKRIRL